MSSVENHPAPAVESEEPSLHPWVGLVHHLLPDLRNNGSIAEEIQRNIAEFPNGNIDTLFWQTMMTSMEQAVTTKQEEMSEFLETKSPDLFVNCAFNTSPKIMFKIMKVFKWELVRERYFYVHVHADKTMIHFYGNEVLLNMEFGYENSPRDIEHCFESILKIFVVARIAAVWLRIHGVDNPSHYIEYYQSRLNERVREIKLDPNPLLKPNVRKVVDYVSCTTETNMWLRSTYRTQFAPDPPGTRSVRHLFCRREQYFDIRTGRTDLDVKFGV